MTKNLVIVESPAKAKTINKILGSDYVVKASMGHVKDLPQGQFGVDIENSFQPTYVVIEGREKIIRELREEASKATTIYLAPDPDREGEAIAWHLYNTLQDCTPNITRISYNEITASAIRKAISEPHPIDLPRVNSQQARRVVDRIVGYKVSPLLWRRVKGGSSAGRVQSVALRLICEREKEITAFVKEKYWVIGAVVRKQIDPRDPFSLRLVKINGDKAEIKNIELGEKIINELARCRFGVKELKQREVSKHARPPFITSTLQQAASNVCGYSPTRTMRIAQDLYEGIDLGDGPVGLITYMRTDSVNISAEAQSECRQLISQKYGPEYVPEQPNFYKNRASAQAAHEAVRPTDVKRTPESLKGHLSNDQWKVYNLIWQRFVASQMAPARIRQRSADIEASAPAVAGATQTAVYLFRASASEILFPGYMQVSGVEKEAPKDGDDDAEEVAKLPPLTEGEKLDYIEGLRDEKETQPPPRYSEAALVRTLEENGVGRPSTYASIISTLHNRKYVEMEKKSLKPTICGMQVNDFLTTNLNDLFNVQFTAAMEESLDKIEEGQIDWTQMLAGFYSTFCELVQKAKGPEADTTLIADLLKQLAGVKEWAPPQQRGKTVYSDEKFVKSISRQLEKGKTKVTQRQADALCKLVHKYREQIPGWEEFFVQKKIQPEVYVEKEKVVDQELVAKIDFLAPVQFDPPTTEGKKVYDDKVFVESLREQALSGRELSARQQAHLDRLIMKYADQLGGKEAISARFGLALAHVDEQAISELLSALAGVKEWKPPVVRGRMTWNDQTFFQSLQTQFQNSKSLSPKQVNALRKMVQRYAAQIPTYQDMAERLGLKAATRKAGRGGSRTAQAE